MAETGINASAANSNQSDSGQSAGQGAVDAAKNFVASAGETLTGATGSVVDRVKENPKAAAAIAVGAVAAVAGAAYGVTKLREGEAASRGETGGNAKK